MTTPTLSYTGHRYPVEIINEWVWLHFRFPLSFREIEEMMLERGAAVSCETIRRWCTKFGQAYAVDLSGLSIGHSASPRHLPRRFSTVSVETASSAMDAGA